MTYSSIKPLKVDFGVERMTTDKICGIINHLCKGKKTYCEVGVFQGWSLMAAAHNNPDLQAYGIDNFSEFDKGENRSTVRRLISGHDNVHLLEMDYTDGLLMLQRSNKKIDVFFYDGNHNDFHPFIACQMANDILAKDGIIIMDDYNWTHTQQYTRQICDQLGWEIDWVKLTKENGDPKYWNGIAILKRKTEKKDGSKKASAKSSGSK